MTIQTLLRIADGLDIERGFFRPFGWRVRIARAYRDALAAAHARNDALERERAGAQPWVQASPDDMPAWRVIVVAGVTAAVLATGFVAWCLLG